MSVVPKHVPGELPHIKKLEGVSYVEKTWFKWFRNNTITANNTLVCLLTILFFITALVLFFWFIISDQLKIILLEKIDVLKIYTKHDTEAKQDIVSQLEGSELNEKKFEENVKKRDDHNIELFKEHMMWWFIVISALIVLNIVYMVYYKVNFSKADMMLVLFVLSAFIAELIFYAVVIKEWIFIGDHEIIKTFVTY